MPEGNLRNDYSALYETVERIRKERFSDLDPELIREIMKLHAVLAQLSCRKMRSVSR